MLFKGKMTKRNADIFPVIYAHTISLYEPTKILCTVLGVSKMLPVNGCAYISLRPVCWIHLWYQIEIYIRNLIYLYYFWIFLSHFILIFSCYLKSCWNNPRSFLTYNHCLLCSVCGDRSSSLTLIMHIKNRIQYQLREDEMIHNAMQGF